MKTGWYLEYFDDQSRTMVEVPIRSFPFSVGRRLTSDLALSSGMVSGDHAESVEIEGKLRLYDRGSTNGTYINGERLSSGYGRLYRGDVVHFADVELSLGESSHDSGPEPARVIPLPEMARFYANLRTGDRESSSATIMP